MPDEFGNLTPEEIEAQKGSQGAGGFFNSVKETFKKAKETVTNTVETVTTMVAEATDSDDNGRKEIQIPIPEAVDESKIGHFIAGAVEKGAKTNPLFALLGYEIDVTVTSAPKVPNPETGDPDEISLGDQGFPRTMNDYENNAEQLKQEGYESFKSTCGDDQEMFDLLYWANNGDMNEVYSIYDEYVVSREAYYGQPIDEIPESNIGENYIKQSDAGLGENKNLLAIKIDGIPYGTNSSEEKTNIGLSGCTIISTSSALGAQDDYEHVWDESGVILYGLGIDTKEKINEAVASGLNAREALQYTSVFVGTQYSLQNNFRAGRGTEMAYGPAFVNFVTKGAYSGLITGDQALVQEKIQEGATATVRVARSQGISLMDDYDEKEHGNPNHDISITSSYMDSGTVYYDIDDSSKEGYRNEINGISVYPWTRELTRSFAADEPFTLIGPTDMINEIKNGGK